MDENILHFCTRRKLSEAALTLLQPHHVAGKASYILQKSSLDGKTPIELAHKNGLTRVAEVAENAMVKQNKSYLWKEKGSILIENGRGNGWEDIPIDQHLKGSLISANQNPPKNINKLYGIMSSVHLILSLGWKESCNFSK